VYDVNEKLSVEMEFSVRPQEKSVMMGILSKTIAVLHFVKFLLVEMDLSILLVRNVMMEIRQTQILVPILAKILSVEMELKLRVMVNYVTMGIRSILMPVEIVVDLRVVLTLTVKPSLLEMPKTSRSVYQKQLAENVAYRSVETGK
jgi:hypothetical protein